MKSTLSVQKLLFIVFLCATAAISFSAAAPQVEPDGDICLRKGPWDCDCCTSILVGKAASADGSTMTSHSCDSNTDRTWINVVPHQEHKPGDMAKIYMDPKRTSGPDDPDRFDIGEIPQVPETYAYINTAYAVMNEHQLAIGETTFGGKRQLRSKEGLLDCPELYRLALERAKTAREAIRVIDALTKEHGYNDVGECFTFADPNETWHFEILGPGEGKIGAVWAAVRIPDDHVGVSANASRIRQIDLDDEDHYMASDNVFSLAEEMGFWSPASGEPFEFCYAYAGRNKMTSRRREWRVLSLIAPSLGLDPYAENYPLSVKAERKLSVQDTLEIFRNYYQDTPFDMTRSLTRVDKEGKVEISPVANPFMSTDYLELFNIQSERTICCPRATYLHVTQSRAWLPDAIGGVVWLGYDNPALTPHTPFYAGISKMPDSYRIDGRKEFRRDCAWWAFRQVSKLATLRYQPMSKDVEKVWKEIEDKAFARQAEIDKQALALHEKDPEKAKVFLTDYCLDVANTSVDRYWKLAEELWSKYHTLF